MTEHNPAPSPSGHPLPSGPPTRRYSVRTSAVWYSPYKPRRGRAVRASRFTHTAAQMAFADSTNQMAFAAGLRRPSGSCLPPFDATFPIFFPIAEELGWDSSRDDICVDFDSANPAQPSAEQQFWADMHHAEAELASGAAATAVKRLESALARLGERLPSRLRGQLQLALGLSCAAQAKHDDAHRWFERCARALSRPDSSSTTTFVPVFNQALQLAALGRCDPASLPCPRLPTLAFPPSPPLPAPGARSDLVRRGAATLTPPRSCAGHRCSSRRSPWACEAPRCWPCGYSCSSRKRHVRTAPRPRQEARQETRRGARRGEAGGAAAPAITSLLAHPMRRRALAPCIAPCRCWTGRAPRASRS